MGKYYCNENNKVYDENFNEIGSFRYTKEVDGLTQITKSETVAMLNFCTEKDASGWYIITTKVPAEAMAAAAQKVYNEMEGKR